MPRVWETPTKTPQRITNKILGGGFKYVLFSPLLGEMIQFDELVFKWVAQPSTRISLGEAIRIAYFLLPKNVSNSLRLPVV